MDAVEVAVDCLSGEAIAESTVISATMDAVDQPENSEVAVDCQSREPVAELTVISGSVDGVDQLENGELAVDCLSGEAIAESTVISATVDAVDQPYLHSRIHWSRPGNGSISKGRDKLPKIPTFNMG